MSGALRLRDQSVEVWASVRAHEVAREVGREEPAYIAGLAARLRQVVSWGYLRHSALEDLRYGLGLPQAHPIL